MSFIELLSQKNTNVYGTKQVSIAFLGDSVTQGCFEVFRVGESGLDTVYDYEHVYHNKLKKMFNTIFPAAPLNIINAGISGGSASNGLERLERDVLRFSPDLVVVCFGLNDVHNGIGQVDTYTNALGGIFRRLKAEKIQTIFMTPNMMNTTVSPHLQDEFLRSFAERFAEVQNGGIMDEYMEHARKVCAEEGIAVCDCYKKWKHIADLGGNITELLSNYLNHPTRDMHLLFAASLFEMIMFGEK